MTKIRRIIPSAASSTAFMDSAADLSCNPEAKTHVVPGGHGYAFEVKKGSSFRIIDLHGQQIVDMMAWVLPYPSSLEHLSMSYTRYVLNGSAPPAVGDCLVTNKVGTFKLIIAVIMLLLESEEKYCGTMPIGEWRH